MDISIDRIAAAAAAIDPVFRNSPQFVCEGLSAELDRQVMLKVETLNPIRSFKGRGSSWFAQNVKYKSRPVICASAGNFGQGVAYAGTRAGLTVKVVAATTASVSSRAMVAAPVEIRGSSPSTSNAASCVTA